MTNLIDITEIKNAERKNNELTKKLLLAKEIAEHNEQRFRNLVETTNDWIWEIDVNGVFTYVSPKIENLLGYRPDELIGKNAFSLMTKEEANRVTKEYEQYVDKKVAFSGMVTKTCTKTEKKLLQNQMVHQFWIKTTI